MITSILYELTDQCQLACKICCLNSKKYGEHIDSKMVKRTGDLFLENYPAGTIDFGGCEALEYEENGETIVDLCRYFADKARRVEIQTGGFVDDGSSQNKMRKQRLADCLQFDNVLVSTSFDFYKPDPERRVRDTLSLIMKTNYKGGVIYSVVPSNESETFKQLYMTIARMGYGIRVNSKHGVPILKEINGHKQIVLLKQTVARTGRAKKIGYIISDVNWQDHDDFTNLVISMNGDMRL